MFRGPAVAAETLDDARGDVGRRGIDHSIVVSKRNVAKEFAIIVAVEGAPAAIAILHAEQPLNATAHGGFHPSGLGILHALESHQHESCVVHVRIKIIAKFKGPSAGFRIFVLDLPIAGAEHLL